MRCTCNMPHLCSRNHGQVAIPEQPVSAKDSVLHAEYEALGMGDNAPKDPSSPEYRRQREIFRQLISV